MCGRVRHTAERAEEFGQKGHGKVGYDDQKEEREELQIGRDNGEVYFGVQLCYYVGVGLPLGLGKMEMYRGDDAIILGDKSMGVYARATRVAGSLRREDRDV